MFSSKTFNGLHFDIRPGLLTIDKVLSNSSSFTPCINLKNSPKPSVESQNTSTFNSESEYDIYSTTPEVRELPDTCLELQVITKTLSGFATLVIQEKTRDISKIPTFHIFFES
jgi:hypothetical protein